MLIKNIEQRIKINKIVSLSTIAFAVFIVIGGFFFAYKLIEDSRKSIYILDNGVPVLAKQTDVLLNRPVEYKAQIELFHRLFFTLAPDDSYIKENIQKSLYLIDDSGKKEYTNLKEKGFYNQIVASSSMVSIHADSITLNIPYLFRYKAKINKGWMNINPFRGTMVIGTPGSGKSFGVINPAIRQMIAKGFCLCIYDFKFV
jgi:conjugative transposon TraK protein